MELKNVKYKNFLCVALFGLFWIIDFMPKIMQLPLIFIITVVSVFTCVKWQKLLSKDAFLILQCIYLLVYVVSIVYGIIAGNHETERILAAINTCGSSVVAVIFYSFYKVVEIDKKILGRIAVVNILIMFFWLVVYLIVGYENAPLLFDRRIGEADYVNGGISSRFVGYVDYCNLTAIIILLMTPIALKYLLEMGKKGRVLGLGLSSISAMIIAFSHSRIGIAMFSIVVVMCVYINIVNYFAKYRKWIVICTVLLVIVAVICFHNEISNLLMQIYNVRLGSSNLRLSIYRDSWNKVIEESPIIGFGVRDWYSVYAGSIPYGSHCTYIGSVYKAGFVGGIAFMFSIIIIVIRMLKFVKHKLPTQIVMAFMLAILGMMVFEDIDATAWSVCIFYSILGLLMNDKFIGCLREDKDVKEEY